MFEKAKTYKSGRVVVLDRFTVSKRFQNGVGLEELVLEFALN